MSEISCRSCGNTIEASEPLTDGSVKCPHCGGSASTLPAQAEPATKEWQDRLDDSESDSRISGQNIPAKIDLPGYHIEAELGRGGMGVVYKARQEQPNRLVALKMILSGGHASQADLARFVGEAEAVAQLEHPNLVRLYQVGQHNGLPYFTMEFVAGGSLSSKLAGVPLRTKEAARLVEQLARGIHHAHERGIVHRDLKPANVLLQATDSTADTDSTKNSGRSSSGSRVKSADCVLPKVTDFGLAKRVEAASGVTVTGAILGTPSYMAPEQAEGKGKEAGALADVYSLGAILYECLTGRPPFRGATPVDTLKQVISDEPVSPIRLNRQVPRDLETICLKCLRKAPARRYADAAALADDLRRFQAGEPIVARPVGQVERALKWARRRPAVAALIAACVLFVLGLVGGSFWYVQDRAQRQAEADTQNALNQERLRSRLAQARKIRTELHEMLDDGAGLNRLLNDPAFWQGRIDAALGECKEARMLQAAGPIDPALQVQTNELETELNQELQNRQTVLALEKAREQHSTWVEGKFNYKGALKKYRLAFAQAGLNVDRDLDRDLLGALAQAIRQSPLRRQLLAALDDFAYVAWHEKDMALHDRLLHAARLADADSLGDRLRDPKLWGDRAAVEMLAAEFLDNPQALAHLTPQTLALLGVLLPPGSGSSERWLRQAHRLHPDDFLLAFLLGDALHRAKKHAEAAGYMSAALGLRPRSLAAWSNLGGALRDSNDLPAAIDEQFAAAWNNLGIALHESKALAAAIDAFNKALAIDTQDAPAWNNLGLALHDSRDLQAAIDAYKKALAIDAHLAKAWYNLGIAHYGGKDLSAAIDAFKQVVAIDKRYAKAWYNLGVALRDSKDLPAAIDAYQQAVAIDKQYAKAWTNLGVALRETKDLTGAIHAFKKALASDAQDAKTWFNLGLALRDSKDPPAAVDAFNRALAIDNQHAFAHANLGVAYRQLGRLSESVEALRQAARLLPKHPFVLRELQASEEALGWQELSKRKPVAENTIKGALSAKDPAQVHEVQMTAGKTYVIEMNSLQFDTYLRLENAKGKVLAENDDIAPDNLNSRLIFTPKEDGVCRIIATSFQQRGQGAYALTIREFAR